MNMRMAFCAVSLAAVVAGCGARPDATLSGEALSRIAAGDYAGAATLLEVAVERAPGDASANANLGVVCWKMGRTDRAIELLRRADDLAGNDERPLEWLAHVYLADRQPAKAREALDGAADRAPLSPRVLNALAVADLRLGNTNRAFRLLTQTLDLDAGYAPAWYNLGRLSQDPFARPTEARRCFTEFLRLAPDHPKADTVRRLPVMAGVPAPPAPGAGPAGRPVAGAPAGGGETTATVLERARLAVKREAYDEALVLLTRATSADPDHADALWELAVLYEEKLGFREEARKRFDRFRARFPNDPRAKGLPAAGDAEAVARRAFEDGSRHQRAGRWLDAAAAYRRALSASPTMSAAAFNLGLALKAAGQANHAEEAFRRAVSIKPDFTAARYMLALTLREGKREREAIAELDSTLQTDPHYPRAHLLLGLIRRDRNETDEAVRHLSRYLVLEPGGPAAGEVKTWLEARASQ